MRKVCRPGQNAVRLEFSKREAGRLEAAQGAAHILSDRAWARLERRAGGFVVTLTLKEPAGPGALKALGGLFERLSADQALRGRLRAASRDLLEYAVSRALVPAAPRSGPAEPAPVLTPEQGRHRPPDKGGGGRDRGAAQAGPDGRPLGDTQDLGGEERPLARRSG